MQQNNDHDNDKKLQQQLKEQQQQEYKQSILFQILAVEARERLAKIKLVKPEKVAAIQNSMIALAQQGKIRNKISEQELVSMLESQTKNQSKITVTSMLCSLNEEESMMNGEQYHLILLVLMKMMLIILILMLNNKHCFKENAYNGTRSRSKSIYRGDQSHTLSMHIRIDNQVSPDKIRIAPDLNLQHKFSHKQNKIQAFRESLKVSQSGNLGKRTQRQNLECRSSKKLTTMNILETQRPYKQNSQINLRKDSSKLDKQNHIKDKSDNLINQDTDQIAVNFDQFKQTLFAMKKLTQQNLQLKKQLNFLLKNKVNNSVVKALTK